MFLNILIKPLSRDPFNDGPNNVVVQVTIPEAGPWFSVAVTVGPIRVLFRMDGIE
jgi:hypothetical protein